MQVELENFRCWKKQNFIFNDKGIILINGTSGSGKSSILNAIYFAITGNGTKIVSYGEKKCRVRLLFNDGDIKQIIRTKSPCRLTVTLKDDSFYEDDEAQKIIDSYFGNNFQQTSYMTQKMIHSFLSLTSIEKMNFLQNYMLDNSEVDNNIILIKKKCKDKITELKKIHIEHKSKVELYKNEIIVLQKKFNDYFRNYGTNIESQSIEEYYKSLKIIEYNPSILKELRNNQYIINETYNKYKQYKIKQEEYNNQKQQLFQDIDEHQLNKIEIQNKIDYTDYRGDEYFNFLNECKSYYLSNKNYETLIKNIENNCYNILTTINNEVIFYKTQIKLSIDKKDSVYEKISLVYSDIDYIKNNIEKWNKSTQTIIEYCNSVRDISKKFDINEYDNVSNLDICINGLNNKVEELKIKLVKKQEELNKLKNNWNLKNKLHKCPKCHIYVRINISNKDPNKQKLVEVDGDFKELNNETYIENINKLEEESTLINNEINDKQKEIYNKENIKKELIEFNTKYDIYKKRINRADNILIKYLEFSLKDVINNYNNSTIYQNKINNINKWLDEYNKYDNEINNYETCIKNIQGNSTVNICDFLIFDKNNLNEIAFINSLIENIKKYLSNNTANIGYSNQSIKKTIDETLDFLLKLSVLYKKDSISNKIKPSILEEEVNSELMLQSKNKITYEHNKKMLENISNKITILNNKIIELNNKLKDIEIFIKENINIEDKFNDIEKKINECYHNEQEYNKYIKIKDLYEDWRRLNNEKRIQNYLYETVSNDIVVHEIFLNKIHETESIALTQCIDSINYHINDYLEKFFPNDSMLVDIVPFKEKSGKSVKIENTELKPGINIKVCYKGEEVELTSLSGGEYDRVSLAIMLSFNHICKSNMILLDESIASLDTELTNEILEKLKDGLINKRIIVVAHQLGTGLFDQIVNTK